MPGLCAGQPGDLEQNQSERAPARSARCGFFLRKKPLGVVLPGYSHSGFAVDFAVDANMEDPRGLRIFHVVEQAIPIAIRLRMTLPGRKQIPAESALI
jgi:hypothetical protein